MSECLDAKETFCEPVLHVRLSDMPHNECCLSLHSSSRVVTLYADESLALRNYYATVITLA